MMNNSLNKNKRDFNIKLFFKRYGTGYLMMAPFAILFMAFVILPVFIAIYLSFTDYNMFQEFKFVGLNNYKLLILDDEIFLTAISNTLIFAVIVGPVGYIMSFVMAWVISGFRFKNALTLAFYAPSIVSGIAISTVWMYIFSPDSYGLINNFLISMGLLDEPILWNSDPQYILSVIIIISAWQSMGNGFLVFIAGFQNADHSIYEAGAIDGVSSRFQELFYLTLPQLKPQLLFGAINTISGAFGVFDIAVTVAGMPSPNYAGHTIVAHLYDYAFTRFQMGYASAIATVLFLMTFITGKVVMRALSDKEGG